MRRVTGTHCLACPLKGTPGREGTAQTCLLRGQVWGTKLGGRAGPRKPGVAQGSAESRTGGRHVCGREGQGAWGPHHAGAPPTAGASGCPPALGQCPCPGAALPLLPDFNATPGEQPWARSLLRQKTAHPPAVMALGSSRGAGPRTWWARVLRPKENGEGEETP